MSHMPGDFSEEADLRSAAISRTLMMGQNGQFRAADAARN